MELRNGEYKIEDEGIWIPKKVLEEWRDHYCKVADGKHIYPPNNLQKVYYFGKADVFKDLLKMFEMLEGE